MATHQAMAEEGKHRLDMKTIGGREMSDLQAEFAGTAGEFAARGLSVSDMIQALYESQRHWKRDNGRPVTDNINERRTTNE